MTSPEMNSVECCPLHWTLPAHLKASVNPCDQDVALLAWTETVSGSCHLMYLDWNYLLLSVQRSFMCGVETFVFFIVITPFSLHSTMVSVPEPLRFSASLHLHLICECLLVLTWLWSQWCYAFTLLVDRCLSTNLWKHSLWWVVLHKL